ncbi:hypothetical protein QVD17_41011 [Tagetes erecta]|uniref:GATA transcription factor n=1 Tax=Tagetes erecta TaxID=13708 RepID=A0AAD8NH72_TARER|nr:hypothetical protein QVD17_41011 [Tagetes erecta]
MDMYGVSSSDFSGVDELLDFSNDYNDVFCTSGSGTDTANQHHNMINISSSSTANGLELHYGGNNNSNNSNDNFATIPNYQYSTDFTDDLCVPSEDVAELEWLSNFVHDSFSNFPANNVIGTINYRQDNSSIHSRSRTKRTRAITNNTTWTSTTPISDQKNVKIESYSPPTSSSSDKSSESGIIRRCTHCASEKTPQWRTGPLGPKTLCNACGVRYKSGRLVPEYRPAASPTFVLTQHSNSHRKVMELRRQKEVMLGQQQQSPSSEYQIYGGENHHHHHHHHRHHNRNNYEIC